MYIRKVRNATHVLTSVTRHTAESFNLWSLLLQAVVCSVGTFWCALTDTGHIPSLFTSATICYLTLHNLCTMTPRDGK